MPHIEDRAPFEEQQRLLRLRGVMDPQLRLAQGLGALSGQVSESPGQVQRILAARSQQPLEPLGPQGLALVPRRPEIAPDIAPTRMAAGIRAGPPAQPEIQRRIAAASEELRERGVPGGIQVGPGPGPARPTPGLAVRKENARLRKERSKALRGLPPTGQRDRGPLELTEPLPLNIPVEDVESDALREGQHYQTLEGDIVVAQNGELTPTAPTLPAGAEQVFAMAETLGLSDQEAQTFASALGPDYSVAQAFDDMRSEASRRESAIARREAAEWRRILDIQKVDISGLMTPVESEENDRIRFGFEENERILESNLEEQDEIRERMRLFEAQDQPEEQRLRQQQDVARLEELEDEIPALETQRAKMARQHQAFVNKVRQRAGEEMLAQLENRAAQRRRGQTVISYWSPELRENVTLDDIEETARIHNMTVEEVMAELGITAGG